MDNSTPPISIFITPTLMITVVVTVIGVLVGVGSHPQDRYSIFYFAAGGMAIGLFIGMTVSWRLIPHLDPRVAERMRTYNYNAPVFASDEDDEEEEPSVILLEDPEGGIMRISRLDEKLPKWTELAREIVKANYAYNQNIFEQIFGRENEIGRAKYHLFSAQFYAAKIVEPYGKGYRLTDFGKQKITQLSKGDWRVLNEIPEESVAV